MQADAYSMQTMLLKGESSRLKIVTYYTMYAIKAALVSRSAAIQTIFKKIWCGNELADMAFPLHKACMLACNLHKLVGSIHKNDIRIQACLLLVCACMQGLSLLTSNHLSSSFAFLTADSCCPFPLSAFVYSVCSSSTGRVANPSQASLYGHQKIKIRAVVEKVICTSTDGSC